MDTEKINKAKRYSKIKYKFALIEMAFVMFLLALIQLGGLSEVFKSTSTCFFKNEILIIAFYFLLLGIYINVSTFWLDYIADFKTEHKFGLSRQNFPSWLKDYFKRLLIGGVLFIIVVEVIYLLLRKFPYSWWVLAGGFYFLFAVVLARIFPVVIIPLFYKLKKLQGGELRERLLNLAKKAKMEIIDIYQIDLGKKTSKANAALAGVGRSKRILLSDTLLESFTQDEVEAALAHELAHYKHRHFWKLVIFSLFITLLGFFLVHINFGFILKLLAIDSISDIKAFPALAFVLMFFNILITPLQNKFSQKLEAQADREAIILTHNSQSFISLIEKLALQNLSDPQPSRIVEIFFYTHPPASKRIEMANRISF